MQTHGGGLASNAACRPFPSRMGRKGLSVPQGTEIVLAEEGERRGRSCCPGHSLSLRQDTGRRSGDLSSSLPSRWVPLPAGRKNLPAYRRDPQPLLEWEADRGPGVQSRPTPRDPDGRPLQSGGGYWATTQRKRGRPSATGPRIARRGGVLLVRGPRPRKVDRVFPDGIGE